MRRLSALTAACCLLLFAAAASAAEFKSKYVEANGLKFHYVDEGKGTPVLFLHGFPALWYMWRDQLTDLQADHRVIAPDLRGVNLTNPKPTDVAAYHLPILVEDVRAFAEKVIGKDKKFVLVGHDWGGLLAWCFALYHPELLDKLVIINAPHPVLFEREMKENPIQRFGSTYTYAFIGYDGAKWEEQVAPNNFAGLTQGILGGAVKAGVYNQDDVAKWVASWQQPGSLVGGLNWYRANHLNPPYNDTHPAAKVPTSWTADFVLGGAKTKIIQTPTLIVWGMNDNALQSGNLSGIEKLVPNSTIKLYPTGDHWVSVVKAKEVTADIRAFVDGKGP